MGLILWRNIGEQVVIEGEWQGELIITVIETRLNRVKLSFEGGAPVWRKEIHDKRKDDGGE